MNYLLDLIVALAKELFASSEQHLLVLTLDFHLSTKVKRLKATSTMITWAMPVTEMATPWPELTLTEVTWRVIVFNASLQNIVMVEMLMVLTMMLFLLMQITSVFIGFIDC